VAAVDHPPVTGRSRWLLAALLVPLLAALALGAVSLWPTGKATATLTGLGGGTRVDATIVALRQVPCADTAPEAAVRCIRPEARLESGGVVALEERASLPDLDVGDHVVVRRSVAADGRPTYALGGYRRGRTTLALAAASVLLLLLAARRRGLQLIAALVVAGAVLLAFTIPASLRDGSPAGIAAVSAGLVAVALLVVGRGPSARSATALAGSLVGLAVAVALAHVAVVRGHLGGIDADPTNGSPALARLLLSGMVLAAAGQVTHAALGAVDHTWDLRHADPSARWRGIARAGMARGRERVAGLAGALALTYAGTGLAVLAVVTVDGTGVGDALTSEAVATVVLGALVGVLAVVATAPATAAIAAAVVVREAGERASPDPRRFRSRAERELWEHGLDD
jgi:uncharacterized membrane protein